MATPYRRAFLLEECGKIPNAFAYVVLFGWPAVCLLLFVLLPIEAAAVWSLLAGYLLLPSSMQVDLPLMPPLDKVTVAAIATTVLCWAKGSSARPGHQSVMISMLALGFVLAPILSSLNNSYELEFGGRSIPGFYPLDAVKVAGRNLLFISPFYIGSRFLSNHEGRATLLKALPIAALFYSVPMLFEIRMSPQLHTWVYGYFPHEFAQQFRAGGFRPVVFLQHGLQVALFACMATIAALVMARARLRIFKLPTNAVAAYLGVILLLCKTLAAAIYALLAFPFIAFTKPHWWSRFACLVLVVICFYPALRMEGIIPVQQIAHAAVSVSKDRSSSFLDRVRNEDELLAKAEQKPIFGWGAWGRNQIYDLASGEERSTADGAWIFEFGEWGWLGYFCLFGLFAASAVSANRAVLGDITEAKIVIAGLTLILSINVIDLLPNSNLTPITFLLAGAIARHEPVRKRAKSEMRSPPSDRLLTRAHSA